MPRRWFLVLIAASWGCAQSPGSGVNTETFLTIDTPENGASLNVGPFAFHATATNAAGLSGMQLEGGGGDGGPSAVQLNFCRSADDRWGTPSEAATCAFTIDPASTGNLISNGMMQLTAYAFDKQGRTTKKAILVNVGIVLCRIVTPARSPGVTTTAEGNSGLVVEMTDRPALGQGATTVQPLSVVVTSDNGQNELNWPSTGTLVPGPEPGTWTVSQAVVQWSADVGVGAHQLAATCTDTQHNVASDVLDLTVLGTSDSDCSSGERLCSQDHLCHPTVTSGAACGCQHPCPADEGCVSGPCTSSAGVCRPGCSPASSSSPGHVPTACSPLAGGPATYCAPLPADQVTPQNMGGACAIGDNCDPVRQNCPDQPLDLSKLATSPSCTTLSPSCPNPTVPYNCVPVGPGVTACVPVGDIASENTGCKQNCGQISGNCARGSVCTQPVDNNGSPSGPTICDAVCPAPGQTAGCPMGQSCVGPSFGPASSDYGVCE